MTWQDELRQLDEKLASGLISADDYRKRRDGLLAAAANPAKPAEPPAGAQQGTGSESTQLIQPVAPPPTPAGPPPDSDRTQAVPQGGWSLQPSYQQPKPPSGDAERTQVVPGVGSPPGGFPQQQFPQQQQPQWGQQPQQDDGFSSPHWSGPSLPPAPWATNEPWNNNEPWVKQGPEAFENGKSRGKVIAISVAVVLLIGLGVGAWLIWGNSGGGQPNPPVAQSSVPPSTPTTPPKIPNALNIADLPGQQVDQKVKDFAAVAKIDYLTKEEIAAYQAGQAADSGMVISQLEGNAGRVVVLVTKMGSADLATQTTKKLVELQLSYKANQISGLPAGVTGTQVADVARAHFTSKDMVVRVEVKASDPAQLASTMQTVLNDQLKVFPADG